MEDYSIDSSIHGSAVISKQNSLSKNDDQVEEESGWTAYFQDFSNNYHHHHHQRQEDSYCSSFSYGSSLISDAATTRGGGAAWRSSSHNNIDHHHHQQQQKQHVFPKKLRLKKTRTKEICDEDDPLEDTASSPVNSPKVSDGLKSNDMNPRKRSEDDHQAHSSLGKGNCMRVLFRRADC